MINSVNIYYITLVLKNNKLKQCSNFSFFIKMHNIIYEDDIWKNEYLKQIIY